MGLMDKYIQEKKEKILVQTHLDSDIVDFANKYRARHKISWTKLITAMLRRLEDEERVVLHRDGSPKELEPKKQQPNTSSRKSTVHGKTASSDKKWLILQLRQAWQNKKTITGPVHAKFIFHFKDFYTAKKEMNLKLGDLDNLLAMPNDCLQAAGIIRDDALIMSYDGSRKMPGDKNKLSITLYEFNI
jgi:Holliday junction resolvase RusA-like endonuclease